MTALPRNLAFVFVLVLSVFASDVARSSCNAQTAVAQNPGPSQPMPSLTGPWLETGFGIGIVVTAPVVGAVAATLDAPGGFLCDSKEDCDANARTQPRTFRRVTIPLVVLGALLVAHGAYRVRRARVARRELRRRLAFDAPSLAVDGHGWTLSGGLHF